LLREVAMLQEPSGPLPIMLTHPILARIDEISRDPAKVAAMRDLLHGGCTAEALADVAVRHEICSRELADYMLTYWANVSGEGWLGEILTELERGILETCELLLSSGRSLSSWWMLGLTEQFRIVLAPSNDDLFLFMATPMLPEILLASKTDPLAIDPYFNPLIQVLREQLDAMLAPPRARTSPGG
jgi:hypothetical protein